MSNEYKLPPDPQNAVLKNVYPWDAYNKTLVTQWLYAQAQATGFFGTFEDFKLRYGAYIEAADPQDIYELIENYTGAYRITPQVSIEQVLHTKNKILNDDIIIEAAPTESYHTYTGQYEVTPRADLDQILRTNKRVLDDDIIIEKIPVHQVDNAAGGKTITIG